MQSCHTPGLSWDTIIPMREADEMIEVSDVAAALIERAGPMGAVKLMKLTYYAQAWHASIYGEPLFQSRIEAWTNGPVAPELWEQYSGGFGSIRTAVSGDATRLSEEDLALVDLVVRHYGHLNGGELSAISHSEQPWLDARAGAGSSERSSNEISVEAMASFYFDKTLDGHTPLELAVIGSNPVVENNEEARQILDDLFATYRNTRVEVLASDDTEYVTYTSGFDESNFEELSSSISDNSRS